MSSKKGKILIVDDNAGIRQALKILLPLHFEAVEAIPSPSTLVSTLERFRPDVVLFTAYADIQLAVEGMKSWLRHRPLTCPPDYAAAWRHHRPAPQ